MENNDVFIADYPYGIFPSNHTKIAKKEQPIYEESEPKPRVESSPDISKLLPLITIMNSKKSLSQSEMLSLILPILSGKEINLSDLIKKIGSSEKTEEAEDISDNIKISSYKKIE